MLQDGASERLGPMETADLQDFVIALSDALAPLGDARRVEHAAVTKLGDRLGADRVAFAEVEGPFLRVRQDYTKGVCSIVGGRAVHECGEATLALAKKGGATVCANVDDLADAPSGLRESYRAIEVKAAIIVSVVKDEQFVAMLVIHMATPRAWTPLEVRMAEATAERLWAAMERAKLAEALAETTARHMFLLELRDTLRGLDEPGDIARVALARLRPRIVADHVSLAYARDGAMALDFEDRAPEAPSMLGLHAEDAFPSVFAELRAGRDFIAEDLVDPARFGVAQAETFRKLGYRRQITHPILRDGGLVATLSAHFLQPGPVDASDRAFVRDVAERLWASIERARREHEIRRREAELAQVQRVAGFTTFSVDLTTQAPLLRSPEYRIVHGLDPACVEETRADWIQRIHPHDRERTEAAFLGAIEGASEKYESEYRIIRPVDGAVRWIYAIGEVERDTAGRPVKVIGANIDITERKRSEQALAESESRQAFLLELSDDLREIADPAEIARVALSRIRARLGCDHVSLASVRETAVVIEFEDRAPDAPSLLGAYPTADCESIFSQLRGGRSFGAEDLGDAERFGDGPAARFVKLGYRHRMTQPILRNGDVIATLSARRRAPGRVDAGDLRFLRDTAERVWTAIERARANREIQRREAEFAKVQRIADLATFTIDLTTDAPIPRSPEYRRLHGLAPDCALEARADWLNRIHPEERSRLTKGIADQLSGRNNIAQGEGRVVRPSDGEVRWIYAIAEVERDADGRPLSITGVNIDITKRKRAELALADSEARARLLLEGFSPSLWEADATGAVVHIEDAPGARDEAVDGARLGDGWIETVHPEDREQAILVWRQSVADRAAMNTENRVTDGKGGWRWTNVRAAPVFNDRGDLLKFVGMSIDITERKLAEQALIESEARYRLLLEAFDPTIFWEFAGSDFVFLGGPGLDSFARHFGKPQGLRRIETVHPDDRARLASIYREGLTNHRPFTFDARFLTLAGDYRWLELRCVPIFNKDGSFAKYVGLTLDTDKRKRAEQALVDSEARLRLLLEGFSPVIWETDAAGKAQFHQGEWGNGDELKGYGWASKVHPDDRAAALAVWLAAYNNRETLEAEYRAANKDGEYRWISVRASPVFDNEGTLLKYVGMNIDIDARKRAEQALEDSAMRSRMLLEGFSPVYWETDSTGSAILIRKSWDDPTDTAYAERLGQGWAASIHPEDQARVFKNWGIALAARATVNAECRVQDETGVYRWWNLRATPQFDSNGALVKYIGMSIDIDARKRAEISLRESEARHRLLLEGFSPVIWESDANGSLTILRSSGSAQSGLDGAEWMKRLHAEDRQRTATTWRQAVEKREELDCEFRIMDENGIYRWINVRASPVFDNDGALLKYVGMNIDIDARKRAEQALIESETRSRLLLEGFSPLFWELDAQGAPIQENPAWREFTGQTREELRGEGWADVLHPDDREVVLRKQRAAIAAGEPLDIEQRVRSATGEYRWMNARAVPVFSDDGSLVRYVGMSIDIHARKSAEQLYREAVHRSEQFSDASSDVLWLRGAQSEKFESVSAAFESVFGLPAKEILAPADPRRWTSLIVPEDRPSARRALETVRQGQSTIHEYRIRRPRDGEFRWIRSTDFPICDDDGRVVCIAGIASDFTDMRQLAERQSVLLAELQHRVRNIVAIVLSITARTARSANSVAEYAELLHGRLSAIARTQSLLTRAAAEGVDLRLILQEEIAAQSAPDAQYEIAGPPIALPSKAAEVMTLAVHELTTNALKYGALAAREGHVSVRWRLETREAQPWLVFEWRESGASAPVDRPPKRRGFGSELIVRRVPYELRGSGSLEITSEGAVCRLEFPIELGPSLLETDAPPPVAPYSGALVASREPHLAGVRVLVVEDDFLLASDLEQALRSAGAKVVGPVADAESATRLIAAATPQVAVLDIDLSGVSSLELATQLSLSGVPIVVVSGYDEAQIPEALKASPRLEKPADLRQVVRALANQAAKLMLH